ncbi:PAS domain S-box protein [Archangium violaceum]|uniref:sensor histidine kinase n=1 Tax=Archangium violaceum TaxID=83451 RepID=UPI00193B4460|nr:ATP-binding protein [Archangium violaceum]QRK07625.1 PAS domain S-box protein [Archangium violaceum]
MEKPDRSFEEQRFSAFFHQALVGIAHTDLSGRFVLVNQRYCEIVGRTQEELLNLRMQDLTHPDDVGGNLELFQRTTQGGPPFIIEKRYLRPDGSIVWVNNSVSALMNAEGRAHLLMAITQDISERKRSETQLRFLSDASRLLSEWPEDAVRVLQGLTRLATASVATMCLAELVRPDGSPCHVAVAHRDSSQESLLQQVMKSPSSPGSPLHPVLQTGEARLDTHLAPEQLAALRALGAHSAMAVPLKARGRVLGILFFGTSEPGQRYAPDDLAMAQELAHRTVATLENARLFREAQEAIQLRDEFLSVASHELRTPLVSLSLQLELVHRVLNEESRRQVENRFFVVRRQLGRLSSLVNDLLDVSNISAGKLELELADVDLVQLTRDVLERMHVVFEQNGCAVTLHAPSEPLRGQWDAARLEQVLINLLGNATRYGQGRPIVVNIRADNDRAWLSVRDEGIGIAPEDLPRIFDRFERAVSRRHYGGLGLGLYITRQIVESLGGQVRVESEPGQGSLFEVFLPRTALR